MIDFSMATLSDLEPVLNLLESNHLPKAGVNNHFQDFILAFEGDKLIACAGLEVYGKAGLLRSVATHQAYRSRGLGQTLVQHIVDLAKHKKLSSISLLTTTAQHYFLRFGFIKVTRSDLPASLKDSEELKGACPDSAMAMILEV